MPFFSPSLLGQGRGWGMGKKDFPINPASFPFEQDEQRTMKVREQFPLSGYARQMGMKVTMSGHTPNPSQEGN